MACREYSWVRPSPFEPAERIKAILVEIAVLMLSSWAAGYCLALIRTYSSLF